MSSINQILNSALMESVEEVSEMGTVDYNSEKEDEIKREKQRAVGTGKLDAIDSTVRTGKGYVDQVKDFAKDIDYKKASIYGGAGLAALGAGLGAVALAKKLRAKKAAAKKAAAKK